MKLENILEKECAACYKPSKCMLGCKVTFSVAQLKDILKDETQSLEEKKT